MFSAMPKKDRVWFGDVFVCLHLLVAHLPEPHLGALLADLPEVASYVGADCSPPSGSTICVGRRRWPTRQLASACRRRWGSLRRSSKPLRHTWRLRHGARRSSPPGWTSSSRTRHSWTRSARPPVGNRPGMRCSAGPVHGDYAGAHGRRRLAASLARLWDSKRRGHAAPIAPGAP